MVFLSAVMNVSHPRTDPSIITLVVSEDDNYCLLARQPRFPPKMYSCLAGFVEPCKFFFFMLVTYDIWRNAKDIPVKRIAKNSSFSTTLKVPSEYCACYFETIRSGNSLMILVISGSKYVIELCHFNAEWLATALQEA